MGIAYFNHIFLVIGDFPVAVGVKVFVHPWNGSVLGRPGSNFLLCIENTHHSEPSKHTYGSSYPGHIIGTVHAAIPDGICFPLDFKYFVSVEGNIEIASEVYLIEFGLVIQGKFQTLVFYFSYIGNGAGKT